MQHFKITYADDSTEVFLADDDGFQKFEEIMGDAETEISDRHVPGQVSAEIIWID